MVDEVELIFQLPGRMYREYEISRQYNDFGVMAKVRETIPSILVFKSLPSTVTAIARWFKDSFMNWVPRGGWSPDPITCRECGKDKEMDMDMVVSSTIDGMDWAATWELARIEKWNCELCGHRFDFPRYNNFSELLRTREGRCGEWARLYTAMLISLGYRARLVIDWFNDHVWTEVYEGRPELEKEYSWSMVDVSNGIIDDPLTYERMGKEFYYILAFEPSGRVVDVTKRYTCNLSKTLGRRMYPERAERYIRDFNSFVKEGL